MVTTMTNKLYIQNNNQSITILDEQDIQNQINIAKTNAISNIQIIDNVEEIDENGFYIVDEEEINV